MIYADAEFYEQNYLSGRAPIIPLDEFLFWSRKATNRINWRKIRLKFIPEYLSIATCEVAEAFFLDAEKQFMAMLPSQSVDGYSRGSLQGIRQESRELSAEIQEIIRRNLALTDLHEKFVYRGI